MQLRANLFIKQDGDFRITKRDTRPYPTELGVILNIEVPDSFFNRPLPTANIEIPEGILLHPNQEVTVRWASRQIAEALKFEVETVEDGLRNMFAAELEKRANDDAPSDTDNNN